MVHLCNAFSVYTILNLTPRRAQQVRQLRSMVPEPRSSACDCRSRCPFHINGPLRPTSITRRKASKEARTIARGDALPDGERRAVLLESASRRRRARRGRGRTRSRVGLCVAGRTDERATGVCGDDREGGLNSGPVSGTVTHSPFFVSLRSPINDLNIFFKSSLLLRKIKIKRHSLTFVAWVT